MGLRFGDFQAPSQHGVASWSLHLFPQDRDSQSKTGQTDESARLDAKYLSALTPVYKLFSQQPAVHRIVALTHLDYVRVFKTAARKIGMGHLVASVVRGSGASIDRASGFRTLPSIQKHGRWKQPGSVARYEKQNRLNQSWHAISAFRRRNFENCLEHLPKTLLTGQLPQDWCRNLGGSR